MLGIGLYSVCTCVYTIILSGLFLGFSGLLLVYWRQKTHILSPVYFLSALLLTGMFLGQWLGYRADDRHCPNHYTRFLSGDTPKLITLIIIKRLKPTAFYKNYTGNILAVDKQQAQGQLLIKQNKDSSGFKIGERFLVLVDSAGLKTIPKPINPTGFNYQKFMRRKHIFHQVNLKNTAYLKTGVQNNTLWTMAASLRQKLKHNFLKQGWDTQINGLVTALFLGERQDLSPELYQNFQATGTVHILAISGLHIGILLLFLNLIFKPVKAKSKWLFLVLTIGLLWFYALLTGFSPSVLRAVIMFSFLQIGLQSRRASNIYNSLFLAALVMLLIDPDYLFQLGFQMSFMAVLSIVSFYPLFSRWTPVTNKYLKWWIDLFWVSVAAQIGVLPLSLFYFHQFPVYFFVANLFAIPLLFVILMTGFSLMILSLLHLDFGFLYQILHFLLEMLVGINQAIAHWPNSLIQNIRFTSPMLVLGIMGGIFFFLLLKHSKTYRYWLFFGLWLLSFQALILFDKYQQYHRAGYFVFHQYKTPVVAKSEGNQLLIHQDSSLINSYLLKNLRLKYASIRFDTLPFYDEFNKQRILHIDSLGIYQFKAFNPDIVVLHHSPKLNLDRLITQLKPELIVADASNYPSYIRRWQHSAHRYHIDFYNVNDQGAFVLAKNTLKE